MPQTSQEFDREQPERQMAGKVVEQLMQRNWHISFAESCTGGLAAARLVEVPNASSVLEASVITYANAAKVRYAGVRRDTIEQYGVVSEAVAGEMAEGIAKNNQAEVGVGISGIAGPTGGTDTKPVGMVCFGFWVSGRLTTCTMQFGNPGRNAVREKSVEFVYQKLEELIR